jgi:hypothetical protein
LRACALCAPRLPPPLPPPAAPRAAQPLDASCPGYQPPLPEGAPALELLEERELLEEDGEGRPLRRSRARRPRKGRCGGNGRGI